MCTLEDLESCLEDHCLGRLAVLNEPIEWRIAIDVSLSYANDKNVDLVLKKIDAVVQQLPVMEHDGLCIDSFDVRYYPGDCVELHDESSWFLETAGDSRLSDFVRSTLQISRDSRGSTDFPAVLRDMAAAPVWPSVAPLRGVADPEISRRYHIFLTDGMHDPPREGPQFEKRKHVDLFDVAPEGFYRTLTAFPHNRCSRLARGDHLHRGLMFIIDTAPLSPEDATNVRSDWGIAYARLKKLQRNSSQTGLHALPQIRASSETLAADSPIARDLRDEVGRPLGALPCFVVAARDEAGRKTGGETWRAVLGDLSLGDAGLKEHCKALAEASPVLEIAPGMFWSRGTPAAVPLYFHVIGESNLNISMRMASIERPDISTGQGTSVTTGECSIHEARPVFPGYSSYVCEFKMQYEGDKLNGFSLPAKVSFERKQDGLEIWSFEARHGRVPGSIAYALWHLPGVFALVLAVISALVFVWVHFRLGGRKVDLIVKVVSRRPGRPILATGQHSISPDGIRYRLTETGTPKDGPGRLEVLAEPQPGESPSVEQVKGGMVFGVLHICWRLVLVVWRCQGSEGPRLKVSGLTVSNNKIAGEIRMPTTRWRRVFKTGRRRQARHLKYEWGEEIRLAERGSGDIGAIRAILQIDKRTWRLRCVAGISYCLLLGCSIVALLQALGGEGSAVPSKTLWWLACVCGGLVFIRGVQEAIERRNPGARRWIDLLYPWSWLICLWTFVAAAVAVPFGRSDIVLVVLFLGGVVLLLGALLVPRYLSGRMARGLTVRFGDVFGQSIQMLFSVAASG